MTEARVSFKKKTGRPATGRGTLVGVSFPSENLAALDAWIASQPDPKPSRPEAIRRILAEALSKKLELPRRYTSIEELLGAPSRKEPS